MTALQVIIKEAKAIRSKSPKMEWKKAVAQASSIYAKKHKGKSPVGKKHAVKKKVAKKVAKKKAVGKYVKTVRKGKITDVIYKRKKIGAVKKSATTMHKDTKSHNVNIRVMSGITKAGELKRITQLVKNSNSKLEKKVAIMLKEKVSRGGYDSLQSVIKDVVYHGLQSGIISDLIYYSDTLKFYKTYKKEILALLNETMREQGVYSPSQIFGRNWDEDDAMAQDTQNQNLLAWFAFEEITRNLGYQLGYDI
jgi:hypothetical protein